MHKESCEDLKKYLEKNEPNFYQILISPSKGINISGRSASELMKDKILTGTEWFKDNEKQHQNVKAYINLVEKYIL